MSEVFVNICQTTGCNEIRFFFRSQQNAEEAEFLICIRVTMIMVTFIAAPFLWQHGIAVPGRL
jgi:hypothetical protein